MERLHLPGRYTQEFQTRNEKMNRGDIPPKVDFYDPTNATDLRKLTIDMQAAMGKKIILPWDKFRDRVEKKAKEKGVFNDAIELYSRDALRLEKGETYYENLDEEYRADIQLRDNPENYMIVYYPWHNTFTKVARQPEYDKSTQSRETGIKSEAAQQYLEENNFLVLGGGVGGRIGVSLAGAGARNITLVDKSPINPHRVSRASGPVVPQMGENQATFYVKQMLDLNPYGNFTAIPKYIGDPSKNPDVANMDDLINWSDFIFQEIDQLDIKGEIHMRAREKQKLCAQITDAGMGTIILLDDPTFQEYPFNSRLTPEVHAQMLQMDHKDRPTFLAKAREIFMGEQNITEDFSKAFEISRAKGYTHIPQSGIAANKAGAEAVKLVCDVADGKITSTLEKVSA